MKHLILFLLLCYTLTISQTYQLDLGGKSNQYPTQIGICDGDVIITSNENFLKGGNVDAVNLINVTKNKSIRVANNKRQVNPKFLIDSNSILFSHWEITDAGVDAGQIMTLDKDFNIKGKTQLNYGGDTEIQSLVKFKNEYLIVGDYKVNGLVINFDLNLNENGNKIIQVDQSKIFSITDINFRNNQLLSCYYNNDNLGIMLLNDNLTLNKAIEFTNNSSNAKIARKLINTNNNFMILTENFTSGLNQFLDKSIHVIDKNYKYLDEYYIIVNSNKINIRQIYFVNNSIFCVGSYIESGFRKSIICTIDENMNLINSINLLDYDSVNDIIYFNSKYYIVGVQNSADDNNGNISYSIVKEINQLCNTQNIIFMTNIINIGGSTTNEKTFNTNSVTNKGYKDALYTIVTSKSNEICSKLTPTPIQGIINKYIDVLEIDTCNNKIKVSQTNEYIANDYVLMIQMQGATIDTTNTPKYGDLIDIGSCGLYEFGYISKIDKVADGSWIYFKNKIVNKYDVNGSVQLVNVPIYENAEVIDDIIGKPWDGKSGGVIVIKANDTLYLKSGNIDASGIGFRGGNHSAVADKRDFQDYFTKDVSLAGEKGEGIFKNYNLNFKYGRGKLANGGGGGNAHNGGGGGGSNSSYNNLNKIGGNGGFSYGIFASLGGIGGNLNISASINLNRLFLGGGGGGGQTSEDSYGSGANGGGIIILDSPNILSNNKNIKSIGLTAENSPIDGAGGGGAGGIILINTVNTQNNVTLTVDGGNGGDSKNGVHVGAGSGGGGTSGKIFIVNKNVNNDFIMSFKRGLAGYTNNGGVTPFFPGFDADENDDMISQINIFKSLNEQTKPVETLESVGNYQKTFSLCDFNNIELTSPIINASYNYMWSTGESASKINVDKAGKYSCLITYNCTSYLAEFEVIDNRLKYDITIVKYEGKCGTDSVQVTINPEISTTFIKWFDGSNSNIRTLTKNGKYKFTLFKKGYCDSIGEISIQDINNNNSRYDLLVSPDTLLFSNATINMLTCKTISIKNISLDTIKIEYLTFLKKLNFSSPNSQFDFSLLPNESKDIDVCFEGNLFKSNYTDSLVFNNCTGTKYVTLLADIPADTLSFETRCKMKIGAGVPLKSIIITKNQLNELITSLNEKVFVFNLIGNEIIDLNTILPNQLIYLKTEKMEQVKILIIE